MVDATIDDLLAEKPTSSGFTPRPQPAVRAESLPDADRPRMLVRVAWGDLVRVEADVHIVGHYRAVLPVAAEAALDAAISAESGPGIIADHTRRRWLGGALGEVTYFPGGAGPDRPDIAVKCAAVAGMGRIGTFTENRASVLYSSLFRQLSLASSITTAAMVPIGSGAGNLTVAQVARALIRGIEGELRRDGASNGLTEVIVIEIDRLRADNLHRALRRAANNNSAVRVADELAVEPGGLLGLDAAAALTIESLLACLRGGSDGAVEEATHQAVDKILSRVDEQLRTEVRRQLTELVQQEGNVRGVTIEARVGASRPHPAETDPTPTRVTVLSGTSGLIWSAATARATVPEREVTLNQSVVDDLVARLSPPSSRDATRLPRFLMGFMVPADLQAHLTGDAPLVIEVDTETARVPWEFLVAADSSGDSKPLAVQQCFARQMRTAYARTDVDDISLTDLRALIIGDPGDPSRGQSLPHARTEAVEVFKVLQTANIDTTLFVGAPGSTPTPHARQAARLDVLVELLSGEYDIIHYAGHGVFEPGHPELAGWLFADGIVAARELHQLRRAPRLVVANACWSARRPDSPDATEPDLRRGVLAPVLADEFLRVGVGHFVGTSWRVPDRAAASFAAWFHSELIASSSGRPPTVGEALRAARERLWRQSSGHRRSPSDAQPDERINAWAAYQHYGDPSDRLLTRQ